MGDKVGENPAALRATVFLLSAKNRGGGVQTPPPSRAKVKGEISVCAAQPTQPDPTRPHHAFEKLISLERVDRFTSGLLCSMLPFNKFRI